MSEEAKAKKKGGKGKMIVISLVLVLLGGIGTAGGLYAAGVFSHAPKGPIEDPNKPVLVLLGENPDDVAAAHGGGEGKEGHGAATAASAEPGKGHHGPAKGVDLPTPADPSRYQATYIPISAPFTSNMVDSDAFAQISIAASTYYDGRVATAMKTHELAIRSAILMMLAEQQEVSLSTPQGKEALQARLKTVINTILKQKTGYGGVDNIYFTNFVIQ